MTVANLLPQDTRAAELAASGSLLVLAICITIGMPIPYELSSIHPLEFWVFLMGTLSILQGVSLIKYPKAEALRTVMSWVNGTFLVWVSAVSLISTPNFGDVGAFVLGLANLGAFIINVNLLREAWNH